MPTAEVDEFTEVDAEAELWSRHFRLFVESAWPQLEPATPFLPNWHIDAICDHLQACADRQIRKLIVNVPPGSMKSLLASCFWPAWVWTRKPTDRFLTASYVDTLSIRDALRSRRLIQSTWYQERWGHGFRMTGDQAAKSRYENDKTGIRIATHVGGATGERANIRVLDDPHNIEEVESDDVREGVIDWYRTVWAEREADAKTSVDVVIMQRLHERDLCGYLLEEIGGFEHLCIPMRFEAKRRYMTGIGKYGEDPRTVEGELLFPARWDEEAVRDKEKRLRSQASGQLQQRPAPDEGGLFKRHWWQYWHYPGKALPPVPVKLPDGTIEMRKSVPLPDRFDKYLQSWDMAFEDHETSDYVVGGQFGKKGANTYLLDLDRDKRDFSETVKTVQAFNRTWPQTCVKLVEKKANGPAVISTLSGKIQGIIAYNPEGSKFARASAYSSVIESGNFFLPHPHLAPWVQGFIDELALFPNGKHDDQVDMMSQALDKLYRPDETGPPVTHEFSRKLHVADDWLLPIPGLECVRFWVGGLHPTCIIAQLLGNGRLNILDAMQLKNGSLRQLIMTRVKPVLARPRYERSLRWRDIGEPDLIVKEPRAGDERGSVVIETELKTTVERGIQDWDTRRSALKELFSRNIDGAPMLQVNPRKTEGEDENIVIEALAGGYQYRQTAAGVVQRDAPVLNTAGYVGNALSHALPLLLFPARGPRPQAAGPGRGLARSKGYAVK